MTCDDMMEHEHERQVREQRKDDDNEVYEVMAQQALELERLQAENLRLRSKQEKVDRALDAFALANKENHEFRETLLHIAVGDGVGNLPDAEVIDMWRGWAQAVIGYEGEKGDGPQPWAHSGEQAP